MRARRIPKAARLRPAKQSALARATSSGQVNGINRETGSFRGAPQTALAKQPDSLEKQNQSDPTPPDYAPVDEEHELRPESSYALSKLLAEEMPRQFSRWSGIPVVGLRSAGDKSWSTYGAERAQTVATGGKCDRRRNGSNRRIRNGSQPRATSRALMVRRGSTVRVR